MRTAVEEDSEPVRVCAECARAKTIRGVWYLLPGRGRTAFVCETCFASSAASLKGYA